MLVPTAWLGEELRHVASAKGFVVQRVFLSPGAVLVLCLTLSPAGDLVGSLFIQGLDGLANRDLVCGRIGPQPRLLSKS